MNKKKNVINYVKTGKIEKEAKLNGKRVRQINTLL